VADELLDVLPAPPSMDVDAAVISVPLPPPPPPLLPLTNVHFRNEAVVRAVRRDLLFDARGIAAAPHDALLQYRPYAHRSLPLEALPPRAVDFAEAVSRSGRPRLMLMALNLNMACGGRMPVQRDTLALAQIVQHATRGSVTAVNVFKHGAATLVTLEATGNDGSSVLWTPHAVARLIAATSNRVLMDHEGYYAWRGDGDGECEGAAAAHEGGEPAVTAPLLFHVYRNACKTEIGQQERHATVTAPHAPLTFAWPTNALAQEFNRAAVGGSGAAYEATRRAADAAHDACVRRAAGAYGAWKRAWARVTGAPHAVALPPSMP
jgi:hypothetical protein